MNGTIQKLKKIMIKKTYLRPFLIGSMLKRKQEISHQKTVVPTQHPSWVRLSPFFATHTSSTLNQGEVSYAHVLFAPLVSLAAMYKILMHNHPFAINRYLKIDINLTQHPFLVNYIMISIPKSQWKLISISKSDTIIGERSISLTPQTNSFKRQPLKLLLPYLSTQTCSSPPTDDGSRQSAHPSSHVGGRSQPSSFCILFF